MITMKKDLDIMKETEKLNDKKAMFFYIMIIFIL